MPEAVWVGLIMTLGGGASGWFAAWLNKRLNRAHDNEEITDSVVKRLTGENERLSKRFDALELKFDLAVARAEKAETRAMAAEDRAAEADERADMSEIRVRQVRNMAAEMLAHVELLETKVPPPPPKRPWESDPAMVELEELGEPE
jgi:hypothetical protein